MGPRNGMARRYEITPRGSSGPPVIAPNDISIGKWPFAPNYQDSSGGRRYKSTLVKTGVIPDGGENGRDAPPAPNI